MVGKNYAGISVVGIIFVAFMLLSTLFMMGEAQSTHLAVSFISPEEVNVCEQANYTIHINNTGTEPAHNITVDVSMPADFHYLNGSTTMIFPNGTSNIDPAIIGQNLTWNLTPIINPLNTNESIIINFSGGRQLHHSEG